MVAKQFRPVCSSVVINTSICGDWAGPVYNNGGFPGTCADAVANATNYDGMYLSPLDSIRTNCRSRGSNRDQPHLDLPEGLRTRREYSSTRVLSGGPGCRV